MSTFWNPQLPLETATYISDLVTSNPASADGLNNADDHMRLIKAALKTTFPSITGAVTASHTTINGLAGWYANGVSLLASGVTRFSTNPNDNFQNPAAGEIDIVTGGSLCTQFFKTGGGVLSLHHKGSAVFDGDVSGPGTTPIGGMIMWLTDTLPVGNGVWCWANGGTLSRTGNGAALYALWGTRYGVGDGSTTFNVINMQEVVPVGKSTMGGASSPGLLASISSGLKTALGALFGSDTNTISIAQLPAHTHANTVSETPHQHSGAVTSVSFYTSPGGATGVVQSVPIGLSGLATAGVSITNASVGSGSAVNNVMPASPVNFIIRIG